MKSHLGSLVILVSLMIRYSSQYVELTVEDDRLCSPTGRKRRIKLDKGYQSGLIVTTTKLNVHSADWDINMRCKFQVNPATSHEGIIAVIQHLSFRRNQTTDECIDYVQFTRKDGSSSQRFCGRFNAAILMDHNFDHSNDPIASGTAFVDEKGELDVVISVAKEHLTLEEEADLSIVFTAYRPCSQVFKRETAYKACSSERTEFCIYSGFFMDSYINCPLLDCQDEQGCSKQSDIIDYYYGNKVLVGAVSSVFVVFIIFILCLWICKTYKVFCWSQTFANPNSATPPNQPADAPRVIELNEQTGSRSSTSQPNNIATNSLDEDKDLPPSYDSLFPAR